MNFSNKSYTDKEKIQLLQRSILVDSYVYYELNENLLADSNYDANTRQLLALKKSNPEAWQKSKYRRYFENFESGTGFDLMYKVRKNPNLFRKIVRDGNLALELKTEYERSLERKEHL